MEKKNNRGTTGKVEEHFPRHVQGLGLRKNSRRTPEKLFGGPAEAKEPQKRHVQGSDGKNRYEGWLVGVKRGWRRKRVAGRKNARGQRVGGFSGSGALEKIGDLLQALLAVWEKDVAGKVAGGECFLTTIRPTGKRFLKTIRPTGKLWGLGKVTKMKHVLGIVPNS